MYNCNNTTYMSIYLGHSMICGVLLWGPACRTLKKIGAAHILFARDNACFPSPVDSTVPSASFEVGV